METGIINQRSVLWHAERSIVLVNLLRQTEVAIPNGKSTSLACEEALNTVQTYYRHCKELADCFLSPRHSADRIATDGEVDSKAHLLCNFTFSASKSVSVQALVGGNDMLQEAHRRAVNVVSREAERYARARVRLDGANLDPQTGNLVVAAYTRQQPSA